MLILLFMPVSVPIIVTKIAAQGQFAGYTPVQVLTGEVALLGDVAEILDEFHFKTIGIDEVGILAEGLLGTVLVDRKSSGSQSLNDRVDIAGNEGKVGQAGPMAGEVPIVSVAIVVEGQVLIVIAKVQPLAVLSVPIAFTGIAHAPVGKGRLIEIQGRRDVIYD